MNICLCFAPSQRDWALVSASECSDKHIIRRLRLSKLTYSQVWSKHKSGGWTAWTHLFLVLSFSSWMQKFSVRNRDEIKCMCTKYSESVHIFLWAHVPVLIGAPAPSRDVLFTLAPSMHWYSILLQMRGLSWGLVPHVLSQDTYFLSAFHLQPHSLDRLTSTCY